MSASEPYMRLRELFSAATHEPVSDVPDVAEAIEEEANAIIDSLEEQFGSLQREYRDYYEMTRSLVAQLEQMEVEREELENLVSQLLRDANIPGVGQ